MWSNCDLYMLEDTKYMLMQCSFNLTDMSGFIRKITEVCPNVGRAFIKEPSNVLD